MGYNKNMLMYSKDIVGNDKEWWLESKDRLDNNMINYGPVKDGNNWLHDNKNRKRDCQYRLWKSNARLRNNKDKFRDSKEYSGK